MQNLSRTTRKAGRATDSTRVHAARGDARFLSGLLINLQLEALNRFQCHPPTSGPP